jgi:ABC-type phosphate/phosphonate transport system substrate-binding protein
MFAFALAFVASFVSSVSAVDPYGPANADLTIVVMDPMSTPLACDCVQGYAQRKYEKLADYLQERTGKTVRVVWSESLTKALEGQAEGKAHIVIGKDSVVRFDATESKKEYVPVAQLTDMKGTVMQCGLFVVLKDDPAASLLDVDGYTFLWGPEDCDEKSKAPRAKVKELEIEAKDGTICESCSVAAKQLIADGLEKKTVAVISSYAAPLLEGCGTIKKGDLRIIGESDEVPFVSVFIDGKVAAETRNQVADALLTMKSDDMLKALETKSGFVAYGSQKKR